MPLRMKDDNENGSKYIDHLYQTHG